MTAYELCIDLGSKFTTIYKKNTGVVLREPTLLLIDTSSKNKRVVKVGYEADKLFGKISDGEVFVHPVVEGVIKNVALTRKLLSIFLSKIVKYHFVRPVIKAIICLPVGLSESEYEDYKKVFYLLGFAEVNFVYNVILSSLAGSNYFSSKKAGLIVNIGAGKTEIASIVDGKILNACLVNVGGNLMDKNISQYLGSSKDFTINQKIASKIKCEVGSLYETDTSNMEVFAQDSSSASQISVIVYARDIMKPLYESYFKILQTLKVFYDSCSVEVTKDIKDVGIIACGGGTKITGLETFFKQILKLSIFVLDNPEISGVLGSEKLFGDHNLMQKITEVI